MLFVSYKKRLLNLSLATKIKLLKHCVKIGLSESNNTIGKMTGKVTEGVLGVIFIVGSVIRVEHYAVLDYYNF